MPISEPAAPPGTGMPPPNRRSAGAAQVLEILGLLVLVETHG